MAKKRKPSIRDRYKANRGRRKGNQLTTPLWDLDRDGITFTMLARFMGCRERFRLSTVEGWSSKHLRVPLEFGSAFHNCLEFIEEGGGVERVGEVTRKYQQQRVADAKAPLTERGEEELEELLGVVEIIVKKYVEFWHSCPTFVKGKQRYYDHDFDYVYQEETFAVQHKLPNGRRILLRGRWDAVFRDPVSKSLILQENKTKSQINEADLLEGLRKDLQTQLYLHTIHLMTGEFPAGVLYNVIRRPSLRRKMNEPLRDFLQRVEEDVDARPEHYFMRWKVEVDRLDMKNFVDLTLDPLLHLVAEWWDSIKHDPFHPWTLADGSPNLLHYERPFGVVDSSQFGNGRGDYWEIVYDKRYDGYYQREEAFPELVD